MAGSALGLAGVCLGAQPVLAAAPQSAAVGVIAKFQAQGFATQLGPIAPATGLPTGRYDVSVSVAKANKSVSIAPHLPIPTFSAQVSGDGSHASASGIGVDSRSSQADTALASGAFQLASLAPPGTGIPDILYLQMSMREATSSAGFSQVFPGPTFATGAAAFGAFTAGGPLVAG